MKANQVLKHIRVISVFVVPLLISSCFSNPKYPDKWEPLQTSNDECINISGCYTNIGEPTRIRLSEILFPSLDNKTVTDVELIQISNDNLKAIALNNAEILLSRVLVKKSGYFNTVDTFKCEMRLIRIVGPEGTSVGQGIMGVHNEIYYFSKSEDGNLIMKIVSNTFGCCLFVPISFRESSWFRYRPTVRVEQTK